MVGWWGMGLGRDGLGWVWVWVGCDVLPPLIEALLSRPEHVRRVGRRSLLSLAPWHRIVALIPNISCVNNTPTSPPGREEERGGGRGAAGRQKTNTR